MTISPVNYNPYIYNTNCLNSHSMGRIEPVQEDLLSQKTDYSGLVSEEANINPLRKGETKGFMDILAMQLQLGQNCAMHIFSPLENGSKEAMIIEEQLENGLDIDGAEEKKMENPDMELANEAMGLRNVSDVAKGISTAGIVWGTGENRAMDDWRRSTQERTGGGFNLFRLRKAFLAYTG